MRVTDGQNYAVKTTEPYRGAVWVVHSGAPKEPWAVLYHGPTDVSRVLFFITQCIMWRLAIALRADAFSPVLPPPDPDPPSKGEILRGLLSTGTLRLELCKNG